MKDENGRGVIRLHDKTTHGGEVITTCDDIKVMGIPVALKDDMYAAARFDDASQDEWIQEMNL